MLITLTIILCDVTRFSFSLGMHGDIISVCYPTDESYDVINFKKMVVSALSHKLVSPPDNDTKQWAYRINETGQEGNYDIVSGGSVQGPKKQKLPTKFRPKYGLECVIWGLKFPKFSGGACPRTSLEHKSASCVMYKFLQKSPPPPPFLNSLVRHW